jgi:formate dehydrogenase assembly factor FdhD
METPVFRAITKTDVNEVNEEKEEKGEEEKEMKEKEREKKKRARKPKVRTGCITCKVRRVSPNFSEYLFLPQQCPTALETSD